MDSALDEGELRVLGALVDAGGPLARSALVRAAGEPHSVIAALERAHPEWLARAGEKLEVSALGRALVEGERAARVPSRSLEALVELLRERTRARPGVKRELDQVHLMLPSVARRALRLLAEGEPRRGLLLLGDDDLTSLALALLGAPVEVVDVDPEIVSFLQAAGVTAHAHDLRAPLPPTLRGRFGAVFSDPPYAPEGFALFGNRALEALRDGGRYWVAFGWSRRASERGLAKQRILTELGLVAEEVVPDFGVYDGAETLGARSALWICRRTPQAKPVSISSAPGDELYTRRRPRRRR